MALSNIFREPRREITETLAGVFLVSIPLGSAAWLASYRPPTMPFFIGFLEILATFVAGAGLVWAAALILFNSVKVVHNLGEGFCNSLARRGLEVRPRR